MEHDEEKGVKSLGASKIYINLLTYICIKLFLSFFTQYLMCKKTFLILYIMFPEHYKTKNQQCMFND